MTENGTTSRSRKPLIIIGVALVAILAASAFGLTHKIRAWYSTATVTGQVQGYLLDPEGKVDGLLLADGKQIAIRAGDALPATIKPGDTIKAEGELGTSSSYGQHMRAFTVTNTASGATVVAVDPKPRHEPPPPPHEPGSGVNPPPPPAGQPPADAAASAPKPPDAPNGPAENPAGAPAKNPANDRGDKPEEPQPVTPDSGAAPAPDRLQAKPLTASGKITAFLVNPRGEVTGCVLAKEQLHFPPHVGELLLARGGRVGTEVSATGRGAQSEFGTFIEVDQLTLDGKPLTQ